MGATAAETSRELQRKREELAGIYKQHTTGMDAQMGVPIYDFPEGVENELGARQTELEELQTKFEMQRRAEQDAKNQEQLAQLTSLERKYQVRPGAGGGGRLADMELKSLGQRVADAYEYKNRDSRGRFTLSIDDVEMKTLLTAAGTPGFAPDSPRSSLVVPYPNRRPLIADMIPTSPTTLEVIKWMEETSFTNNASMTGEGYTKPESAVDWDEKSTTVRKIAHYIPVTQEQVDDVPGFMQLLNNDMILMLRLKEEQQILNGTGIGQELTGFLQHANLQSQAFDTNNADTVLKAMTKISWTGFATPTAVIMNPNNWETIRLLKTGVTTEYLLGSPLIDVTPRLWGVPVVITTAITAGTALVGDFVMYAEIRRMQGVRIDVSDSHSTYFVENKLAVRAEMREALVIKRGSAYCQCTSLT